MARQPIGSPVRRATSERNSARRADFRGLRDPQENGERTRKFLAFLYFNDAARTDELLKGIVGRRLTYQRSHAGA